MNSTDTEGATVSGGFSDIDLTPRSVLIIDGSYAEIGAHAKKKGRISYLNLRRTLETLAQSTFVECWFYDQHRTKRYMGPRNGPDANLIPRYNALKLAPPHGPQFQLKLYSMKDYQCSCPKCDHPFKQLVQKGVDIGIATKMLSLSYENVCDRIVLFAGDGDFYDSVYHVKNVLRKELWIVGYANQSVSADLQQVASRVIWIDDIWADVVESTTTSSNYSHSAPARSSAPPAPVPGKGSVQILKRPSPANSSIAPPPSSLHTTSTTSQRPNGEVELERVMALSKQADASRIAEREREDERMAKALSLSAMMYQDSSRNTIIEVEEKINVIDLSAESSNVTPASWKCPLCTLVNSKFAPVCGACETPRD